MKKIRYNRNELIGKLIFLSDVEDTRPRKAMFKCPLCGTDFITEIARAKLLKVVSCGCFRKQNSTNMYTKHGHAKCGKMSPEYVSWQRVIQRCSNPNYENYNNYGGRGVKVCERWKKSFANFLSDMGNKPFPRAHIDRIDNSGNYEPKNCRWVSCKENARNKRNNLVIEWKGKAKTLSQWSELLNINKNTLRDRLNSKNWTVEEALTIPAMRKGETRKRINAKINKDE